MAVSVSVEVLALAGGGDELLATLRGVGDDLGAAPPAQLTDVELFIDDAVMVPTNAPEWTFHAIVPSPDDQQYIERQRLNEDDINAANGQYIYSFPAVDLIENYHDHADDPDPTSGLLFGNGGAGGNGGP